MTTFSAETEKFFLCFSTVLTWRQRESGLQSNRSATMIENPVASVPDRLTNAGQTCTSTYCWRSDNKPSTVTSPRSSVAGRSCCCFSFIWKSITRAGCVTISTENNAPCLHGDENIFKKRLRIQALGGNHSQANERHIYNQAALFSWLFKWAQRAAPCLSNQGYVLTSCFHWNLFHVKLLSCLLSFWVLKAR